MGVTAIAGHEASRRASTSPRPVVNFRAPRRKVNRGIRVEHRREGRMDYENRPVVWATDGYDPPARSSKQAEKAKTEPAKKK